MAISNTVTNIFSKKKTHTKILLIDSTYLANSESSFNQAQKLPACLQLEFVTMSQGVMAESKTFIKGISTPLKLSEKLLSEQATLVESLLTYEEVPHLQNLT